MTRMNDGTCVEEFGPETNCICPDGYTLDLTVEQTFHSAQIKLVLTVGHVVKDLEP